MSLPAAAEKMCRKPFGTEITDDNAWGLLTLLCEEKRNNLIRFDYGDRSITPGHSAVNAHTGATKSEQVVAHAKTFKVKCGAKSDAVYLQTSRSMRTENDEGEFDFRSYRMAEIQQGAVPFIEVNQNFSKEWTKISLFSIGVFPQIKEDGDEKELADLIILRAKLETLKAFVDKMKTKMHHKFSKRLKAGEIACNSEGQTVTFQPPTGTSKRIIDESGAPVKTEKMIRLGVKIIPDQINIDSVILPEVECEFDNLPTVHVLCREVAKALSVVNEKMRPWELGVYEYADSDIVTLAGQFFKINNFEYSDYDYTAAQRKALADGVFSVVELPVSRGAYVLGE